VFYSHLASRKLASQSIRLWRVKIELSGNSPKFISSLNLVASFPSCGGYDELHHFCMSRTGTVLDGRAHPRRGQAIFAAELVHMFD
jgi:hypothetical protein